MKELSDFQKETVKHCLKQMFSSHSFSICSVDSCLKITGGIPNEEDYAALRALHCVSWSDMSHALRRQVFEKTLSIVASPGFNMSIIDNMFEPQQPLIEMKKSEKKKLFKLIR